jgi:regulatory protein
MSEHKPSPPDGKRPRPADRKKNRPPRKITPEYLHNAGLHYLQRFSSSSENFRTVLLRKARRSCAHHPDQDYETCARMIDDLVRKFIDSGLLNDELYARGLAASLRRRGKSEKAIMAHGRNKGLDGALTRRHLDDIDHDREPSGPSAELEAALVHARRKKLGPFRGPKPPDARKELASMARAGFSYDTARKALALGNVSEEED